jgi:hypothetical protein
MEKRRWFGNIDVRGIVMGNGRSRRTNISMDQIKARDPGTLIHIRRG